MKNYLLTLVVIFGLTAAVSADTIKATVNGMVCGFCATGIEKTFKAQPEVKTVDVDLENKLVTIQTRANSSVYSSVEAAFTSLPRLALLCTFLI